MAATTSTSCSGFFSLRSNSDGSRARTSPSHGSPGCRKLDGMATWFINGVTTAFFASLERCSCFRISTEEDVEDGNDLPLIFNDGNLRHNGGGATSRKRTGKGKKSGPVLVEDYQKQT